MADIINFIDGNVQIIFERGPTPAETFSDAIWFTQEQYEAITTEEILTIQQQRYDNWLALTSMTPDYIIDTPEQ